MYLDVKAFNRETGRKLADTVEQYLRRGAQVYIEGHLLMSPSPTPKHARASGRLYLQLTEQSPGHVEVLLDIDVDLQLVPAREPGFSRRPDLVVVDRAAP